MALTFLRRQLLPLLLAALWPAWAFALKDTYEGLLVPNNRDAPIAIAVQLEEAGSFLSGRVKVDFPLEANVPIEDGRNVAGSCNLRSVLSSSATLRLYGSCTASVFEGNYTIYYTKSKAIARGTFRLTPKVAGKGRTGPVNSTSSMAACLKANTRCLMACPRGDESVEYLCANHCRSKLQACQGNASKELEGSE